MKFGNWSRSGLPFAAWLAVLGLLLVQPDFIQDLRLRVFDLYQQLSPRPYAEAPVRIVDLDDASLEKLGQWPWPRSLVARLVDRLSEMGAAVVAFDIVFAEPDRTSPRQLADLWEQEGTSRALRDIVDELPDHDDLLAQAMARTQVVTGFVLTREAGGRTPEAKHGFTYGGADPATFLPGHRGAVSNLPKLEAAAVGNGSFSIERDRDGRIRRVPLLHRLYDRIYPSLAVEALRVALGASTYMARSSDASGEVSWGEQAGLLELRLTPDFTVPTDALGRVWIHFSRSRPERYVPAWKVIDGSLDPSLVAGNIVFVGTSAAGLADLRATPLHPQLPGVEIHAQLVEQILQEHYLERPFGALGAEICFMLLWGLCLIWGIRSTGAIWSALLGVGGVLGACGFSWYAFVSLNYVFDPLFPSMAGFAVYLTGSLVNYMHTESERGQIRSAFSRYLNPSLVKTLSAHPERLRLGGETREMTFLFADIRGFTTISEIFDAESLTHLLNTFLTPMTDVILNHSGTIDKYMGDAIMAFWNAPLDDPDHIRNACNAALAMNSKLEPVNELLESEAEQEGRPHVPIRIGIGLNTGSCCVGNMGSEQRFDYSVVGDEVNLASRLEGQSKNYGVTIVIGENTQVAVENFATLELDLIKVKGKTRPARIYALLGDEERAACPDFQELSRLHVAMLEAYRKRDFEQAGWLLEECAVLAPDLELLYQKYRERIELFQEIPPEPEWDGVYVAKDK